MCQVQEILNLTSSILSVMPQTLHRVCGVVLVFCRAGLQVGLCSIAIMIGIYRRVVLAITVDH